MKTCRTCQVGKPLEGFRNRSSSSDGKENSCKECRNLYDKNRQKTEAGKVSNRKSQANWRINNKSKHLQSVNEYQRKYSEKLTDSYIKKRIKKIQKGQLKELVPTPELIETYRVLLKLKRGIKNYGN